MICTSKILLRTVGLVAVSVIGIAGCGGEESDRPETAPVSGKVTYKDAPVVGATVAFQSSSSPRVAVAKTNDQGEFTLTTFDSNDGAVLGDHSITITKKSASTKPAGELTSEDYAKSMEAQSGSTDLKIPGVGDDKDLLPAKYADPDASGLTRTVAAENNVFNFDLTDD